MPHFRITKHVACCLLGAALYWHGNPAWAQAAPDDAETRRAARQLAEEGGQLFDEGHYADAVDRLHRAYELVPAPTIAVLEGQALARLGRLVDAAERYETASRFPVGPDASDAIKQAVGEARTQAEKLRARIAQLVIVVQGATRDTVGLEVTVDGKPIPLGLLGVRRPTDPGTHQVVAKLPGGQTRSAQVILSEGEQERVVLAPPVAAVPRPAPAPTPPVAVQPEPAPRGGSSLRTLSYVSFGIGGAGLATGVVAGAIMLGKKSSLDAACSDQGGQTVCGSAERDTLDAFRTYKTVSWIGYGVGLAGAGVGLVLLLTAPAGPEPREKAGIVPLVGPSQVGLRARF